MLGNPVMPIWAEKEYTGGLQETTVNNWGGLIPATKATLLVELQEHISTRKKYMYELFEASEEM